MLKRLQGEGKTRLYMPTLCNGNVCGIETRNTKVGDENNFYQNGIEIKMRGDGNLIFETWTVCDGMHILNSRVIVDTNGNLISKTQSKVNCFSLGWIEADQDWLDMYLEELEHHLQIGRRKWEVME